MRRKYERPSAYFETFTPNEYVAACGDHGTVYNFKCTAGGGEYGGVYQETNGQAGLQIGGRNGDRRISYGEASYHACGTTHQANADDDFIQNCYYIPQSAKKRNGWDTSKAINVVVWRGPRGDNTHCTTNLDMKTWETAKS